LRFLTDRRWRFTDPPFPIVPPAARWMRVEECDVVGDHSFNALCFGG